MSKLDQLKALRETKSSRGGMEPAVEARQTAHRGSQENRVPREYKHGRPRLEDRAKTLAATKPWAAAGMSRRTWYRRRAEQAS